MKDDISYFCRSYENEEQLEKYFIDHHKKIFGEDSLFFLKRQIKTKSGIGSIPDGFVLSLPTKNWYIVEVELAKHHLFNHIVPQITKFYRAIKDPSTISELRDALYNEVKSDPYKEVKFSELGITEIHKLITEILETETEIIIVIDQITEELQEVCEGLPLPSKAFEFKTYYRDGKVIEDHIHKFDSFINISKKIEVKNAKIKKNKRLTKTKKRYLEFWTEFKSYLEENRTPLRIRKPRPRLYYGLAIGKSHHSILLRINRQKNKLFCELYIEDPNNTKENFEQLKNQREDIENEIGSLLEWKESPHQLSSRITLSRDGDITDREKWNEYFKWLKKYAELFYDTFYDRLQQIN